MYASELSIVLHQHHTLWHLLLSAEMASSGDMSVEVLRVFQLMMLVRLNVLEIWCAARLIYALHLHDSIRSSTAVG